MEKQRKQNKQIILLALSFALAIFYVAAVMIKSGIFFETNDDRVLMEVLSGAATGEPQPRNLYTSFWAGCILAGLYQLTDSIAWYGWLLIICHVAAIAGVCYSICTRKETWSWCVMAAAVTGVLCISAYCILSPIQYTSTAAWLAAAAFFCLLVNRQRKTALLWFGLLLLPAYWLRSVAVWMLAPIGGAVCSAFLFVKCLQKRGIDRDAVKRMVYAAGVFAGIVCVTLLGQRLGYGSAEWSEYLRFNDARTQMFDYTGIPEYEEVREILERYGVSENSYEGMKHYMMADDRLTADCMEELAGYAKARVDTKLSLSELPGKVADFGNEGTAAALKQWLLCLYILAIACILFGAGSIKEALLWLLPLLGIFCGKLVSLLYLLYQGRVLFRVYAPLYLGEGLLVLAVMILFLSGVRRGQDRRLTVWLKAVIVSCLCLGCIAQSIKLTLPLYWKNGREREAKEAYYEEYVSLTEYFKQNPENRYLVSVEAVMYYCGGPLETRAYTPGNWCYVGSWYGKSPALQKRMKEFVSGEEPCYLLMPEGEFSWLSDYVEEAFSCQILEKTRLQVSEQTAFSLYRLG